MEFPLWSIIAAAVTGLVFSLAAFAGGLSYYGYWQDAREARAYAISDGACNIAVIPVVGDIVAFEGDAFETDGEEPQPSTSGDYIAGFVRAAEADPFIAGILFRIDSYGGVGTAGETMASALARSPLPSVALVRDAAASAGYMAALGADVIIASRQSAIGSIGVTSSYLDQVEKNEREGFSFVGLSSGKFKDSGNPNKPLSAEERVLFERDLGYYHRAFVDMVAEHRGMSVEQVEVLADGSTLPGELALEKGLIDMLGNQETARAWFAQTLGIAPEGVVFCE